MSITSIANSIFDDNIYTLNSSVHSITNSITIANKQKLVIPPNFSLDISANNGILNIASGGALLNYGLLTIDGSLNSSGVYNNEAGSRLINNKSLSNSGVFINRGTFSNQTNANLVNSIGAEIFNKNRGIINNSSQITNNGTFSNYSTLNNSKNFLNKAEGRVMNPYANNFFNSGAGTVVNYGQYINEINYATGTTIFPPYNLIAAGTNHSLGINYTTKQLYGWGDNSRKQLTTAGTSVNAPTLISLPATSSTNWKYIEAGGNSSFGITDDSSNNLYVWGDNSGGHLGIGSSIIIPYEQTPTRIFYANTNKKWIGAASGLNHLLALDSNNALYSCGDNTYGQLGYNNIITTQNTTYDLIAAGLINLQPVSSSSYTMPFDGSLNFGIKGENGSGDSFGNNGIGGIGAYVTKNGYSVKNGDTITVKMISGGRGTRYTSNLIGGNGGNGYSVSVNGIYIAVSGGGGGSSFDSSGGNAGNFGGNTFYLVGDVLNNVSTTFTDISGNIRVLGNIGMIINNAYHYTNINNTPGNGGGRNYGEGGGNGISFNNGSGGEGGDGSETGIGGGGGGGGYGGGSGGRIPSGYGGGGGGSFSISGGTIQTNTANQTPFMTITNATGVFNTSLKPISISNKVVQLSCGDTHSLAIDASANLWTFGNNSSGQLGYVTQTATQNIPQKVTNPNPAAKWIKAVGGSNHSLGLQSDGSIYELNGGALMIDLSLNSGIPGFPITSFLSLDGNAGYFGTYEGYIYKVHLNNNNMVLDSNFLQFPSDNINTSFISKDGTTGYFCGLKSKIYKVNLNSMTLILTSQVISNSPIFASFISNDINFGYFVSLENITKVNLNDLTFPGLNINFITNSPNNFPNNRVTSFLSLDGTTVYVSTISPQGQNSYSSIYKVILSTSVVSSLNISLGNTFIITSFISKDGTTGYFGTNFGNQFGNIYKVDLNSMTLISTLTLPQGQNSLFTSFLSKDDNIGYFGGTNMIYIVNLITMQIINSSNIFNGDILISSFLSLDGKTGYFGGYNQTIYKVNLPPIQSLTKITAPALTWIDIAAGGNVSLALSSENKLYAWGSDISGQLGLGTPNGTTYTTPQLISAAPTHFLNSCVGGSHTLSIGKKDGNLYAWGTNTKGQLGHNNTTNSYTPQLVLSSNLNPIV